MNELDDLEVHLATCQECSQDLARYRELLASLAALRDDTIDPAIDLPERIVMRLAKLDLKWRGELRRIAHHRGTQIAAASVTAALVGAGAIGLLWWRAARRTLRPAA